VFDWDGTGQVGPEEFFQIGKRRSELGHRSRVWTRERNAAFMLHMDTDGSGGVSSEEWVSYYTTELREQSDRAFIQTVEGLIQAATW